MKRLIVNADDFGLTSGVSRGILRAYRQGIVTSTSLLVNRPVAPELLNELKASQLGVGLHLNLTLGAPLSPSSTVPSLVDAEEKFIRDAGLVAARANPDHVEAELRAQLSAFTTLMRRPPTHLDSHHHVGRHARIQAVVLALAKRLGVPVRSQDDEVRRSVRAAGLRTPDHFFGESGPEPYWSKERAVCHLAALPDGVSEFMTHPGFYDQALAYSRYGKQREVELQGLTAPEVRQAVAQHGIRLCHFGELG